MDDPQIDDPQQKNTAMPTPKHTTPPRSRGFSLTEMLVVISIAGLLIGLTYPVISSLIRESKVTSGINTIGMAVGVARQFVEPAKVAEDLGPTPLGKQDYSGTAAIVCPTGEVRIVVNNLYARDGNDYIEDSTQNGYFEVQGVNYAQLPDGAGFVGIYRGPNFLPNPGVLKLIAPPFAIAFNENGHLYFGDTGGYIYYDGDGDGRMTRNKSRSSVNYDPSDWTGEANSTNAEPISSTYPYRALPFDRIECVPGVIVYNAKEFDGAGRGFDSDGVANAAAVTWLEKNGVTIFFSPHTGEALDEKEGS